MKYREDVVGNWYVCAHCGGIGDTEEHVIPKSHGGSHNSSNIVHLCYLCNTKRSNYLVDIWDFYKYLPPSERVQLSGYCWRVSRKSFLWKDCGTLDEYFKACGAEAYSVETLLEYRGAACTDLFAVCVELCRDRISLMGFDAEDCVPLLKRYGFWVIPVGREYAMAKVKEFLDYKKKEANMGYKELEMAGDAIDAAGEACADMGEAGAFTYHVETEGCMTPEEEALFEEARLENYSEACREGSEDGCSCGGVCSECESCREDDSEDGWDDSEEYEGHCWYDEYEEDIDEDSYIDEYEDPEELAWGDSYSYTNNESTESGFVFREGFEACEDSKAADARSDKWQDDGSFAGGRCRMEKLCGMDCLDNGALGELQARLGGNISILKDVSNPDEVILQVRLPRAALFMA